MISDKLTIFYYRQARNQFSYLHPLLILTRHGVRHAAQLIGRIAGATYRHDSQQPQLML